MAGKKSKHNALPPMHSLSKRQQAERRFARQAGFKDEYAYRKWARAHASLPESHPAYFKTKQRGEFRIREINRIKRIDKVMRTPARRMLRKYQVLVEELDKMSQFSFADRYRNAIAQILKSSESSARSREQLRRLQKRIETDYPIVPQFQPPVFRGS